MRKTKFTSLVIEIIIVLIFNQLIAKSNWVENGQFLEQTEKVAPIIFVKMSKDYKSIYTFCKDSTLRKWDYQTGNIIFEKKIPYWKNYDNYFSDISDDGRFVLISSFLRREIYKYSAEIIKYDLEYDSISFKISYTFDELLYRQMGGPPPYAFGGGVGALFSFDNKKIFSFVGLDLEYSSVSLTGRIDLWDAISGVYLSKLNGNFISSFIFSNDGTNYAYNSLVSFPMESDNDPIRKTFLNNEQVDSIIVPLVFTMNNKYLVGTGLYWDLQDNTRISFNNIIEFKDTQKLLMTNDDKFLITLSAKNIKFFSFPDFVFAEKVDFPESDRNRYCVKNSSNNDIVFGGEDGILRILRADILKQELQSIFNSNATIYVLGDSVHFNDFSKGNPSTWHWDFGDGTESLEQNPIHVFKEPKEFSISLIVSNDTFSDTLIREKYIIVKDTNTSEMKSLIFNQDFVIYPNPANEYLIMQLTNVDTGLRNIPTILMYNILGECVKIVSPPRISSTEVPLKIDVSDLAPGVYFILIDGKIKLFIKE